MLRLPDESWTTNLDEAYAHLLEIHFPGCKQVKEHASGYLPRWLPSLNRNDTENIITEDRIQWALDTTAPLRHQAVMLFILHSCCKDPICSILQLPYH